MRKFVLKLENDRNREERTGVDPTDDASASPAGHDDLVY
jgi:hypothetical protein